MKFIYILIAQLLSFCVYAGEVSQAEIEQVFNDVVEAIAMDDYTKISDMFHYPPSYTGEDLRKDRCNMEHNVRDIIKFVGKPGTFSNKNYFPYYYAFSTSSGDLKYWQKYPKSVKITKEVNFERKGKGVFELDMSYIDEKLELRSFSVAFYVSDNSTKGKMAELFSHMKKERKRRENSGICQSMDKENKII